MVNQFLTESNDALARVSKYQSQVDSTRRITSISDDPQSTLLALRARNKLSNLDLYKSNITTATSYLKEAESSASELNEILKSAYDDVMSASSGSKTTDDQKILAEDLRNLRDEIVSIANASIGTSYIFGGYNFTGSVVGGTKTPPFSTDPTTGDLTYNGINLSQLAWKADFGNTSTEMSGLQKTLTDIASAYSLTSSDVTNRTQAQKAADALSSLVAVTKDALTNAEKFGIDTSSSSPNYTALKAFYTNLSTLSGAISSEAVREPAGDYILDTAATQLKDDGTIDYDYYKAKGISVYTADELANKFSSQKVDDLLNSATLPTSVKSLLTGSPSQMDAAVSSLKTEITTAAAAAESLATGEATKKTALQIGTAQTVDVTLTGLDLLGTGSNNIYHVLTRAINKLMTGASAADMSSLITSVQNAQSQVLNLETTIGATQNRLTLITDRYTQNTTNYTEMKSNAEDADVTEAIMHLSMAQQAYNAALAGGTELIKTSLIDFLN